MFECPVCRSAELTSRPYETWPPAPGIVLSPPYEDLLGRPSYEVCPCCGFEFGNDDNPGTATPVSFEDYRAEWEAEGRAATDALELTDAEVKILARNSFTGSFAGR